MQQTVKHFSEKLLKIEKRMKTDIGMCLARKRHLRLKEFFQWWMEEARLEPYQRPVAFVKPLDEHGDEVEEKTEFD